MNPGNQVYSLSPVIEAKLGQAHSSVLTSCLQMARKITVVAANTATVKINAPFANVVRLDIPKARILKLDSVLASDVIINTHSKCKPTLHLNNKCKLAVNGLVIRNLAPHEVSLEVAVAFTAALVAGCLNFALTAGSVLGGVTN